MAELTVPADDRRRALVRMKAVATGLLVVAAALYVVLRRWEDAGAPAWVGYARAAAEAGMIGGLADWFAVTALFRRPLGLPIPHTAIIPTRKDTLGRNLGDFVGSNFLAEDVVRAKVRRSDPARRAGEWLSARQHAERVTAEIATLARAAVGVLRDDDVQALLERALLRRLSAASVAPGLGRLLARVVDDRAHDGLIDLAVDRAHDWLLDNRDAFLDIVVRQAPSWSPRVVDELVAARLHTELVRITGEIRSDPEHAVRGAVDRFLARLATDLQSDPDTMSRFDSHVLGLVTHPEVRRAGGDLVASARSLLLELVDDPGSDLRSRITAELVRFGGRLTAEPQLSGKLDTWLEDAAAYVVVTYRDELIGVITDTVQAWDAVATSHKVELQVGRDLQFIRVNGTVVGAAAGVAIHAVAHLLL